MSDDGFYEEDEPIEDLQAAWKAGDEGTTSGARELNQQEKSIVARSVARLDGRPEVQLHMVSSGTRATTASSAPERRVTPVVQVRDEAVSALEYRVG